MPENMVVGRGLIEILPDFRKWGKQLAADLKTANRQMDGSSAGFKRSAATVGASMVKVGKGASVVALGVAAGSLKMAGDFQAHTAVLQTAAGETTKGLATVRKGILSISENTGTGIKNLTDGMYTIEKAGFRGSNGLKVLRAAAQGAREENANLADVTNAMTSIMASYHLKANQSVMVMNAMKTAAGEGKINMEEFSSALSTVLPIASANKISFDQVAGAMATLTQHGTSAREATHELGATIRALASPNMVAQREMARFGLSSVDVSQNIGKRGLTGTIELLTHTILSKMGPSGKILLSAFEGTKQSAEDARIMISKMPPEFQKVSKQFLAGKIDADQWNATIKGAPVAVAPMLRNFTVLVNRSKGFSRELKSGGPAAKTYTDALKKMSGGAIGLNTILQLSGESFDGFKERVSKVGASLHHNTKDVEGWKTTQKLLNVQLDMVKQRLQVMAITIGSKLIPIVAGATRVFTEHKSVLLILVGVLLSVTGILSAVYVGTKLYAAGAAIAKVAQVGWTIATMAQTDSLMVMRAQLALLWLQEKAAALWTGVVTAAQWAWNAAMDANPIGLIVLAIAALVAAIVYVATKTQFFQKLWKMVWGGIKMVVQGFVHWLKANWQLVIFTILTGGIGLAVAMIVRHWDAVKHAFSVSIDWIKKNWPLLLAILTGPIGLAVLYIVRHWKQITDGARNVWHDITQFFVRMGTDIGSFFSKLPGEIGHFFSTLPGIVGHWFTVAGTTIYDFFKKLPGRLVQFTVSYNKALYNGGKDLIMGLFNGARDFFTKTIPDWARNVKNGFVSFFKAVFGIHSPSTVMAAIGVDLIKGLFQGMLKIAQTVTTFLSDHIGRPIINLFTHSIPNAARGFSTLVTHYWGEVRDFIGKAWNTIYRAAIAPIIRFFQVSIPNAGRNMRDAIVGFVRTMVLHVLDSFGAIIRGASKLFGWVPGVGGKLRSASRAFQSFRDDVNRALGGIKDKHPVVSVGMKVMSGKDAGLVNIGGIARATGGPVFGPGTETSDSIPAMLSKGEHVWTAKEVKKVGGQHAMTKLRALARKGLLHAEYATGGAVRGFANGGAVDVRPSVPSAHAINAGVDTGFYHLIQSNMSALIKAFREMTVVGGKTAKGALAWARTQVGKPYIWGGVGPRGYDCSGFQSAIENVLLGHNPYHRLWATGAFSGRSAPAHWVRGLRSAYEVGITNAGVGHTAGTLAGVNVESSGGVGVRVGGGARGAHNGLFPAWYGFAPLKYDAGGLARGVGAIFKGTSSPERVLSPRQTEAFERLVDHLPLRHGAGGTTVNNYHLHTHGPIGSKHELLNWFVEMEDQLNRRKRR